MTWGCGNRKCKSCQPFTYGCEYCGATFLKPVANGDVYMCESCGYVVDEQSDETKFVNLV
jgi:hypothetical protein